MSSFSDIVDQLKQNNRSEVDQLKENNTSEVEQLKKITEVRLVVMVGKLWL